MEFLQNIDWISWIITVVISLFMWVYKNIGNIKGKTEYFILKAEQLTDSLTTGGEKFNWVVDQLYALLPAMLKPFIKRTLVEEIVQTAFDSIQEFAKEQINKNWK